MTVHKKYDFPVSKVRRFLEPGPVVLVSSAWKGETNIMTMGWHTYDHGIFAVIDRMHDHRR